MNRNSTSPSMPIAHQGVSTASSANRHSRRSFALAAASMVALAATATSAIAQQNDSDIIVTARKRQETLLDVPVVATVITQESLARNQTLDLKDVARLATGLSVGEAVLSIGTQISLRGVGTSSLDPGIDQSVSLNIDGLSLSHGLAFQAGMFDLGQIEVLKGPQALFFGKSSPGGVISLRTADPTDEFEVIARAGYEFEARQKQGELIVSGPVSSTLKLRLAARYSDQDGFFKIRTIITPNTGAKAPASDRLGPEKNFIIRGTALWEPTDRFNARLKANYTRDRQFYAGNVQIASCPDGNIADTNNPALNLPFIGGGEDCKVDRIARPVDMDPAFFPGIPAGLNPALFEPILHDGVQSNFKTQYFGTLEMNFLASDTMTLTSTTSYYKMKSDSVFNTLQTTSVGATLASQNEFKRNDFTQELRLNSDTGGPADFTLGGFYQDSRILNGITTRINTAIPTGFPPLLTRAVHDVNIATYSLFGQLRLKPVEQVEVAIGGRWTDESRSNYPIQLITGVPSPAVLPVHEINAKNMSPELTVTYKPTENMTIFGSLKRGFKSGSFTLTSLVQPSPDTSFGDEKVEGGEIGLKTRMFDRQLAFNLAAYYYRFEGLQVGVSAPPASPTAPPVSRTINAGKASIRGVEMDAAFSPHAVEGLTIRAGATYNVGRFDKLDGIPCYHGQLQSEGCNQVFNPVSGLFTAQNLDGIPLIRAPKVQASFGFDYELSVGGNMRLGINNTNYVSSRYLTILGRRKDFYRPGYFKADVGLTLKGPDDRWELGLIGKNIANKITAGSCNPSNHQNAFLGGVGAIPGVVGSGTGGTVRGRGGIAEVGCLADRGRQVWITATFRPFN